MRKRWENSDVKHILLVDDHQTFLAGTAVILERHGFRVTMASRGADAIIRMEEAQFHLFVFDLRMAPAQSEIRVIAFFAVFSR